MLKTSNEIGLSHRIKVGVAGLGRTRMSAKKAFRGLGIFLEK